MDLLQSIVLGIVQGITEFLPISSTGHLVLFPWFFNWHDPGLAFDVALHLGTLFAVVYYFWRDWVNIVIAFIQGVLKRSFKDNPNGRLAIFIAIATIPGALAGIVLEDLASGVLRHPLAIAFAVFFFGIVLYLADKYSKQTRGINELTLWDSLLVGIFQGIAIIPGVSRSGITITGGLFRNFKRDEAARFSFLLSAPLIFGALVFESRHIDFSTALSTPFIAGIVTSALFGFLSIKYLIKFVQKESYTVFVLYRIVLAIVIVAIYMQRGAQ